MQRVDRQTDEAARFFCSGRVGTFGVLRSLGRDAVEQDQERIEVLDFGRSQGRKAAAQNAERL